MRKKKKNSLNIFLCIILLFLIGVLVYKIYQDNLSKTTNNTNSDNKQVKDVEKKKNSDNNNKKEESEKKSVEEKKETNTTPQGPSNDEKIENQNENRNKNKNVNDITIELVGDEEITIKKGSKYRDAGVKAYYSDGTNAIKDIEIDNTVDTSKEGTYTVSYYVGNNIVIRRVTVE